MLKTFFAVAAVSVALAAPAFADDMAKCDEATMKMVHEAMMKDTDPAMKKDVDMAGEEMKMAEDAMKANKMDECSKHIMEAKKHMMMK
jgi:hypothetical protein